MKTFGVDANNDLFIGPDGNLAIVVDLQAVLENCEHAAKTIYNEMVLAQGQGLPYFEAVWIGVPNIPLFEATLRAALAAVDGVVAVNSLATSVDGGVLTYTAEIATIYGDGALNG